MKILVDEMPKNAEDCPWSYPTENPWNDHTVWFCQWAQSNGETCPMVNSGECPYFKQDDFNRIIDAFNAIPNTYPFRTQEVKEFIIRNPNRKD